MKKLREADRGRPRGAHVAARRRRDRRVPAPPRARRSRERRPRRPRRDDGRHMSTSSTAADMPLDVTIITGMSGAGRSEAAHVLEDLGFFVIDNLPPMLIGKVAELARGERHAEPLRARRRRPFRRLPAAISPPRSTSCAAAGVHHASSISTPATTCSCAATRRAAAGTRSPTANASATASRSERALLEPLVGEADLRVDTSILNVHELRDRLRELFSDHGSDDDRFRSTSSRSATSTACPSTSTSCSTAGSSRTRIGSRSCARCTGLDEPGPRLRARAARDARVPRRARPAVRAAPARLRTRRKVVPLDRVRLHRRPASQRRDRRAARRTPAPPGSPHRGSPPGRRTWRLSRRRIQRRRARRRTRARGRVARRAAEYTARHHRDRQRRRRRRLVGAAAARSGRRRAGRPAQEPRRARRERRPVADRVRAPLRAAGSSPGTPLGNLVIVGLGGDPRRPQSPPSTRRGACSAPTGRVIPATADAVTLKADIGGESVVGQVAVDRLRAARR